MIWFVIVLVAAMKVGSMLDMNTYLGHPVPSAEDRAAEEQVKDCPMGNRVLVDEQGYHCVDTTKNRWNTLAPMPMTCPEPSDVTCWQLQQKRYDLGISGQK